MLVSAAIDPYRKSYGKAASSSEMLDGSSGSERITASPRKMWVPGVHACATAGVSISASRTASARQPPDTARGVERRIWPALDPDALTLPANGFPKISQLVLHDVVDCVARGIDVVAHLLHDIVDGKAVEQFLAAFYCRVEAALRPRCRPARTFGRPVASPSSSFNSATACPLRSLKSRQAGKRRPASRVPHERSDRTPSRRPASQQEGDARAYRRSD